MITEDGRYVVCDIPDCEEKFRNHYWGRIHAAVWYFTRSGLLFCPKHIPGFVKKMREK